MNIILNGESCDVAPGLRVAALLETLHLGGRRVAVEVNREIVPGSMHAEHILCEGDRVEVVHAIGGG